MKKILIVDNHIGILRLLTIELTLSRYEVITAQNGIEALRQIDEEIPDLVLLDITMPVMDGFEVLTRLRKYSGLPVIAQSFDMHNKEKALSLGADDFLVKPYEIERLVKKISRLIH